MVLSLPVLAHTAAPLEEGVERARLLPQSATALAVPLELGLSDS